jgi:hypothetical protein
MLELPRSWEDRATVESNRSTHELRCQGRWSRSICLFLFSWQWREGDKLIRKTQNLIVILYKANYLITKVLDIFWCI